MMREDATLLVQRINHGQSEIWLEADGKELTARRILATNEGVSVTQRLCASEVSERFRADFQMAIGQVATVVATNLNEVAAELRLTP